jgi:hypothetical protein
VGFIAFALSGLAMLLGWQVTMVSGLLVAVYLLAACIHTVGVARELAERIRFSVHSISAGQGMLLMSLVLVACGSLYMGYAAHVEQEGFSLPEVYVEAFMEQLEKQIEARVPPEEREKVVGEFREAAGLFMPLVTITRLLAWVPTAILSLVFRLLAVSGVTQVLYETQEVEKLVID